MAKELAKNFEENFECPICMEIFVDPRVLSCLHSYCKQCAQRLVKQEGDRHVISCPNCRKDTEVSILNLKGSRYFAKCNEQETGVTSENWFVVYADILA